MELTRTQERMLAGEQGEAVAFAMRILVRMGELFGARQLMPIAGAHLDGCCYPTAGDAGLDFAEKLAGLGARVVVPTTTNTTGRDIERWREFLQPEELAEKNRRMERAYLSIGALPTWTCAPYLTGFVPRFGEQAVWAESNAIAYGNSVLGIRTHRYGDFIDACAAVTGLAPRFGLHLTENRRGQVRVVVAGIEPERLQDPSTYALLGYFLGKRIGTRIPVLEGIPADVSPECLKALCAAGAASGALALVHVVGVTPEAPTLERAFGGPPPPAELVVCLAELEGARRELDTAPERRVDLVFLGCPHFSHAEAWDLVRALAGRKKAAAVECLVNTNRAVHGALRATGLLAELERSGARVTTDGCPLHWDLSRWGGATVATNSGKFAKYIPSCLGRKVLFGSLRQCAEAIVTGEMPE